MYSFLVLMTELFPDSEFISSCFFYPRISRITRIIFFIKNSYACFVGFCLQLLWVGHDKESEYPISNKEYRITK